jgi:four helix bundle protein
MFDHERLVVYRFAVEFDALIARVQARKGAANLRDQLDRASASIVANIAEGAGRRSPPDKRRFYAIARGSATECAALLDMLRNRSVLTPTAHEAARQLLLNVIRILSRLSEAPPTALEPELELELDPSPTPSPSPQPPSPLPLKPRS